jgi:hypothetical protein
MKTKLLASFTLILLVLTSCEKDEETSVDSSTSNNISSTTNTSTTSSTSESDKSPSSKDYYPLSINNTWEYAGEVYFEDMATGETMEYVDTIPGDTIIEGELYYIVKNDGGGESFVRKSGSDYLMINSMVNSGDVKTQIVLKEDGAEGDKWGYEISTSMYGYTTRNVYTFSIFEKLDSYEVNGTTYLDVLVMNGDTETYLDDEPYMSLKDSRYYYAKGIGLIRSKVKQSYIDGHYLVLDLVSYKVN